MQKQMVFFIVSVGPRQNLVGVDWVIADQQEYYSNKCEKSTFLGLKNAELIINMI